MKLSELKSLTESRGYRPESMVIYDMDYWTEDGDYGLAAADVEVEYSYEPAHHTDHPYGSTTAREHHPASVEILSVKLLSDATVYDAEGDKIVGELKAGTELTDKDWWKESWLDDIAETVTDKIYGDIRDHHDHDDYDYR